MASSNRKLVLSKPMSTICVYSMLSATCVYKMSPSAFCGAIVFNNNFHQISKMSDQLQMSLPSPFPMGLGLVPWYSPQNSPAKGGPIHGGPMVDDQLSLENTWAYRNRNISPIPFRFTGCLANIIKYSCVLIPNKPVSVTTSWALREERVPSSAQHQKNICADASVPLEWVASANGCGCGIQLYIPQNDAGIWAPCDGFFAQNYSSFQLQDIRIVDKTACLRQPPAPSICDAPFTTFSFWVCLHLRYACPVGLFWRSIGQEIRSISDNVPSTSTARLAGAPLYVLCIHLVKLCQIRYKLLLLKKITKFPLQIMTPIWLQYFIRMISWNFCHFRSFPADFVLQSGALMATRFQLPGAGGVQDDVQIGRLKIADNMGMYGKTHGM